jgi:anti-sigma factor RsiW
LSVPSPEDRLVQDAVAGHVRSLLSDHTVDVVSSDRHTVKPWFAGKIDFAPTVYDLAAEGYTLVGGRLDYLNRRTVAALVYRYRQHIISVFMAPVSDEKTAAVTPAAFSAQGYHVVHWTSGDMDCWAVSDTDATSLAKFQTAFLAH